MQLLLHYNSLHLAIYFKLLLLLCFISCLQSFFYSFSDKILPFFEEKQISPSNFIKRLSVITLFIFSTRSAFAGFQCVCLWWVYVLIISKADIFPYFLLFLSFSLLLRSLSIERYQFTLFWINENLHRELLVLHWSQHTSEFDSVFAFSFFIFPSIHASLCVFLYY